MFLRTNSDSELILSPLNKVITGRLVMLGVNFRTPDLLDLEDAPLRMTYLPGPSASDPNRTRFLLGLVSVLVSALERLYEPGSALEGTVLLLASASLESIAVPESSLSVVAALLATASLASGAARFVASAPLGFVGLAGAARSVVALPEPALLTLVEFVPGLLAIAGQSAFGVVPSLLPFEPVAFLLLSLMSLTRLDSVLVLVVAHLS